MVINKRITMLPRVNKQKRKEDKEKPPNFSWPVFQLEKLEPINIVTLNSLKRVVFEKQLIFIGNISFCAFKTNTVLIGNPCACLWTHEIREKVYEL